MALSDPTRLGVGRRADNHARYGRAVIALLAFWYDYLVYGRGVTFVVIIAISAAIRLARRGSRTKGTVLPPQPYQQYPQQQYPQQPYPQQQQYPQQPYPQPQQQAYPPAPVSPFAAPRTDPQAPGQGERPRSTPLPPILGGDPPAPPR
ncbi:MAG: hypothetical protein JWN39_1495 [Ilumatobacteraceae bacterium]|nr:hypothetical protein [Ilumatobacteraceae bacterium]